MATRKKAPTKKAAAKKAVVVEEEDHYDERWEVWEGRIKRIVPWAIGVLALVNELFYVKPEPRATAVVLIGSLLGLNELINALRGGAK